MSASAATCTASPSCRSRLVRIGVSGTTSQMRRRCDPGLIEGEKDERRHRMPVALSSFVLAFFVLLLTGGDAEAQYVCHGDRGCTQAPTTTIPAYRSPNLPNSPDLRVVPRPQATPAPRATAPPTMSSPRTRAPSTPGMPPIYYPPTGSGSSSTYDGMAGRAGAVSDGMNMTAPTPGERSPLPPGYAATGPCNEAEARTNIEWVLCRDGGARGTYDRARGAGQDRLSALLFSQRHNPNAQQSIANCAVGVEALAAQRETRCVAVAGPATTIPAGADACPGGGYCNPGNRCHPNGRSCYPANADPCLAGGHCEAGSVCTAGGRCMPAQLSIVQGRAHCGGGLYCDPPNNACHPSGRACMPKNAMACGPGHCQAGTVCADGNRCIVAAAASPAGQPADAVACGAGYCQPGELCHPSGRTCYRADPAACGSGRCEPGWTCGPGGVCRPPRDPAPPSPERPGTGWTQPPAGVSCPDVTYRFISRAYFSRSASACEGEVVVELTNTTDTRAVCRIWIETTRYEWEAQTKPVKAGGTERVSQCWGTGRPPVFGCFTQADPRKDMLCPLVERP
jgi:hypothetical protein